VLSYVWLSHYLMGVDFEYKASNRFSIICSRLWSRTAQLQHGSTFAGSAFSRCRWPRRHRRVEQCWRAISEDHGCTSSHQPQTIGRCYWSQATAQTGRERIGANDDGAEAARAHAEARHVVQGDTAHQHQSGRERLPSSESIVRSLRGQSSLTASC
jgi:hypothetical protein